MTRILVPTAGQATAAGVAEYTMQIARSIDAEIVALHVVRPGMSREAGELSLEYFAKAGTKADVPVECHFREGGVLHQIVDFAEENRIDLIVMGASNGRIVDQWISSDVRESTTIPVLVIPFQVFEEK